MKKQYIKPVVETLEMDEQMELLQSSIFTNKNQGALWLQSRGDNTTAFDEDEDISGEDF